MKKAEKILEQILRSNTVDNSHYIQQSFENKTEYYKGFLEVAHLYFDKLGETKFRKWLVEKMGLQNSSFNRAQYIQFACEASVVSYFIKTQSRSIELDKKVNPKNKSDVECQFKDSGFTYNVEVKTPDIAKNLPNSNNDLNIATSGRLPDKNDIEELEDVMTKAIYQQKGVANIGMIKNLDNTLKDFLMELQKKSDPSDNVNVANILVVCCDDSTNMQSFYDNLYAYLGFFTHRSYLDPQEFTLVDAVVFTNLYFKHNNYSNNLVHNHWDFNFAFSLSFPNPHKPYKNMALRNFSRLFADYAFKLSKYNVPGNIDPFIKDRMRVNNFIKEQLEEKENIYLFEEPE